MFNLINNWRKWELKYESFPPRTWTQVSVRVGGQAFSGAAVGSMNW